MRLLKPSHPGARSNLLPLRTLRAAARGRGPPPPTFSRQQISDQWGRGRPAEVTDRLPIYTQEPNPDFAVPGAAVDREPAARDQERLGPQGALLPGRDEGDVAVAR